MMGEINFNPEGFDAAVDNLYDAQKEIEKLRRRCDDLEKLIVETECQQAEIEKLRALLTKVQNVVLDTISDVSKMEDRFDYMKKLDHFEGAIIEIDVMLNGGDGG
jgi:predicted RNase H-like nuclease (RuvC/YqgF family)